MDPTCVTTFQEFRCSMDEFKEAASGARARLCELSCYFAVVGKGPWWLEVARERYLGDDVGEGPEARRRARPRKEARTASPSRKLRPSSVRMPSVGKRPAEMTRMSAVV